MLEHGPVHRTLKVEERSVKQMGCRDSEIEAQNAKAGKLC